MPLLLTEADVARLAFARARDLGVGTAVEH